MKADEKIMLMNDFILHHALFSNIHEKEVKSWIDEKYFGKFSDHNNHYVCIRIVKIFLTHDTGEIYNLNEKKILDYLKDNPKLLKEFKEKRKELGLSK